MHNQRTGKLRRIAHLAEGCFSLRNAKMSTGVIRYSRDQSVAVIDSTQAGKNVEELTGIAGTREIPVVASLEEALRLRPDTLLIGTTPVGGQLPAELRAVLAGAIRAGLDVISGTHQFLSDDPEFSALARDHGVELRDLRKPVKEYLVGGGLCRWAKSYIALMIGTDCAIGKMTVALEIQRAARTAGLNAEFVATGQTGIAIAGWGSPIDAIPGDFMAGCLERDMLSVDGADLILVEGQGSLLHPGYSSVTLALLHGCCPDALVLCHQLGRERISKIREVPIPDLQTVTNAYLQLAAPVKPTELAAVAVNSAGQAEDLARVALREIEDRLQVPATDPLRFGAAPLLAALERHRDRLGKGKGRL